MSTKPARWRFLSLLSLPFTVLACLACHCAGAGNPAGYLGMGYMYMAGEGAQGGSQGRRRQAARGSVCTA